MWGFFRPLIGVLVVNNTQGYEHHVGPESLPLLHPRRPVPTSAGRAFSKAYRWSSISASRIGSGWESVVQAGGSAQRHMLLSSPGAPLGRGSFSSAATTRAIERPRKGRAGPFAKAEHPGFVVLSFRPATSCQRSRLVTRPIIPTIFPSAGGPLSRAGSDTLVH